MLAVIAGCGGSSASQEDAAAASREDQQAPSQQEVSPAVEPASSDAGRELSARTDANTNTNANANTGAASREEQSQAQSASAEPDAKVEGKADAEDVASAAASEPAPATASGWDGRWRILGEQSRLGFTGTQNGKAFSGSFGEFAADIKFDPANLDQADIKVSVTMKSAKTGDKQRDTALPENDWFAIKDYPQAVFKSQSVTSTGQGRYQAVGTLTMRDVTKSLTLPFTLSIEGNTATAKGGVSIVRTDFGVGQGEWNSGQWVALEVAIDFDVTAIRP